MLILDRAGILALIPHAGAMCLLDGVRDWDPEQVVCCSASHRRPDNPLRRAGRLAAVHGFEYGAQAVAVHGGLLARAAGVRAAPGYLAAIRDGWLEVARLDDIDAPLEVTAWRRLGGDGSFVYDTQVSAGGRRLVRARVVIVSRR